jgi:hypothetical protein
MSGRRLIESPCVRIAYYGLVSVVLSPFRKLTCLYLVNVGKVIID